MDSETPSSGLNVAEPGARKGFWSFVSDDESVERGQINFWPIAETLLAIGIFWYVALKLETFFLLYTSLFVAPLLFLRSKTSVEQGMDWVENGFFPLKSSDKPEARELAEAHRLHSLKWIAVAAPFGVLFAVGYPAAKYFLDGHEGSSTSLLRVLVLAQSLSILGVAVGVAGA